MSLRARTFLAGFAAIILIVLSSNTLARPALLQGFLLGPAIDPQSIEAVDLSFTVPTQSEALEYGSQAEVFRFTLNADAPYTIRYLTLAVRHAGLELSSSPEDWKLYLVQGARPNFSTPIGYGEAFHGAFLRLRFEPSPSVGYRGADGRLTFALVSSVLKTSGASSPWLAVSAPDQVPEGFDWAFAPGWTEGAWMDVVSSAHVNAVRGLPTPELVKH